MNSVGMMKPHPAAALFPLLEGDELQTLVEDIRQHGVRQPVVTYRGELLDGRNRIKACDLLGRDPPSVEYDGDDPVGFVISANLRRRHMSDSQRALVAAGLATMRQGERTDLSPVGERLSQAQTADLLNVGKRSVERASEVLEHGVPELVAAVQRGEASVSAAAVVASLPAEQQRAAVADGVVAAVAKQARTTPAGDAEILDSPGPAVRLAQRPAVAEVVDVDSTSPVAAGDAGEGGIPPQPATDRATAQPSAQRTQASRTVPDVTKLGGSELIGLVGMGLGEIQKRAPRARKKAFSAIDVELGAIGRTKAFRADSGATTEADLSATFDGYDERTAELDNLRGAIEALTAENERLEVENTALQEAIALAKLPDGERLEAQHIIAALRAEAEALRREAATVTTTLNATETARNRLLDENAQLKRQVAMQQKKTKQLGGDRHDA